MILSRKHGEEGELRKIFPLEIERITTMAYEKKDNRDDHRDGGKEAAEKAAAEKAAAEKEAAEKAAAEKAAADFRDPADLATRSGAPRDSVPTNPEAGKGAQPKQPLTGKRTVGVATAPKKAAGSPSDKDLKGYESQLTEMKETLLTTGNPALAEAADKLGEAITWVKSVKVADNGEEDEE